MMRQYTEVRRTLPDNTLLFFRLGDFYELFEEDAKEGSRILGITLTHRHGQPMAGIPYHSADNYITKLLEAGKKVAICDQVETPQAGKIVKRELTRILTPGTTLEDHQIDSRQNHYLLAIDFHKQTILASWLDITTGDFQIAAQENPENLLPLFASLDPKEIIIPEEGIKKWRENEYLKIWFEQFDSLFNERPISELPDYHFDRLEGARSVMEALKVLNLDGFGLSINHSALGVAGALVYYSSENLCAKLENLRKIKEYKSENTLLLDPSTLRNLEIFKSAGNTRSGSLLSVMDATTTSAGARLLENYLSTPIIDLETMLWRQNCVEEFIGAPSSSFELRENLKSIRDIPRILGRLQNRIKNPREPGGIKETLQQLPDIIHILKLIDGEATSKLTDRLSDFPKLRQLLENALAEELPSQMKDGGYIRENFDEELDRLRNLTRNNKTWISDLERAEQERTGIKNLKIKYNNVFGFFIEVTKSNLNLVPEDYIRKQTMTNAERYYTSELKDKEKEILHADEKSLAREEFLMRNLVKHIIADYDALIDCANALAEIDLFLGWAKIAREWNYCKPELDDSNSIDIREGRHPVVEQMLREENIGVSRANSFVPNDTLLSSEDEQIALITGPNMAGKSTYIRQVALITLMAQVGSWVPAKECQLGLVDRIFSRVGASDELSRGNSTFMVEMNETANILNNVTEKSLVILDEIGRGTSTYDGLSIAWSVVEHLHTKKKSGAKTLFATHYHELTQLERELERVRNYCVAVKEWNDEIIFVRQVISGYSDRSYGIHVARLAGLPQSVIDRAKVILEKLESDDSSHNLLKKHIQKVKKAKQTGKTPGQLELF